MPRLRCFICNGPHFERECPEREVLNTLIKKSKKAKEDARPGLMQMLGALHSCPKLAHKEARHLSRLR